MGKAKTKAEERSPKSRVFGIRLSLPQIHGILKLLHAHTAGNPIEWSGTELDSLDASERKLLDLYLSIVGQEWELK